MQYPTPIYGPWNPHSDHRAITTEVHPEVPAQQTKAVPHSILRNESIRQKVLAKYIANLPNCQADLLASHSGEELERSTERLARAFLEPWLGHFAHKPARFRPGWTFATDKLAKQRPKLLRARSSTHSTAEICHLDKRIRRLVRRRRRELHLKYEDELPEGPMSTMLTLTKQLRRLQRTPWTLDALYPACFTQYLPLQQPDCETSPSPKSFLVPPTSRTNSKQLSRK